MSRNARPRVMHMLHELEVGVGELGVTVRNGLKWADATPHTKLRLCVCTDRCTDPDACGLSTLERIGDLARLDPNISEEPISCENCDIEGLGVVQDLWEGHFAEIPARLLEHEHEVRSRAYSGLLDSMRKAYGQDFNEIAQVVVVAYLRVA